MKRFMVSSVFVLVVASSTASAADLVRGVRSKLSAGDLASGVAAVEDYRRATGVDAEYWNAVGWLARGAAMLGRPDLAAGWVEELRAGIPEEADGLIVPLGARIEVESKLIAAREGRGHALEFLRRELETAKDPALRSRINKNVNLISMEGALAPPIDHADYIGRKAAPLEEMRGKPVLLYLWANWCGDCRAQHDSLAQVWERYRDRGLEMIAVTRYYGSVDGEKATPADEKKNVEKVWKESYGRLQDVPVTIDSDAMVRYGASATPTFVLIDRDGIVRLYTPTRLSEAELSRRIEEVMGE